MVCLTLRENIVAPFFYCDTNSFPFLCCFVEIIAAAGVYTDVIERIVVSLVEIRTEVSFANVFAGVVICNTGGYLSIEGSKVASNMRTEEEWLDVKEGKP